MRMVMSGSTVADRILRQELRKRGMSEDQLPEPLRDKIIKKGPKGPTGQLIVRRITGVENNKAAQIVRQFEENTGGKEDIVEKLEAIRDTLPRGQLVLLELLKSNSKKKLPRLLAETNVELGSLMKSYSNGALMLGWNAGLLRLCGLWEGHSPEG
jgi:hypothetical protein